MNDLRPYDTAILDQGDQDACVGYAAVSTLGNQLTQAHIASRDYSPMFDWTEGRIAENRFPQNIGLNPAEGFIQGGYIGFAPASSWSSDDSHIPVAPSASLATCKITYSEISVDMPANTVASIKAALANDTPVDIGIYVRNTFWDQHTGTLAQQAAYNPTQDWISKGYDLSTMNTIVGAHALEIVAYDASLNGFYAKNSWGVNSGDQGYIFLPTAEINDVNWAGTISTITGSWGTLDLTHTPQKTLITQSYIGLLGRAGDNGGLQWWASVLAGGTSHQSIDATMVGETGVFNGMGNSQIVDALYVNMYGRHSDSGGNAFWAADIANKGIAGAFEDIVACVMSGTGSDHDTFVNRVQACDNLAINQHNNDLTIAAQIVGQVTADPVTVQSALLAAWGHL